MTNPNGTGRDSDRNPTDPPTDRFPALQKALEKATDPIWPTTDPDD